MSSFWEKVNVNGADMDIYASVPDGDGPFPAVVVAQPGRTVAGDAALRAMFAEFIASGVDFTYGAHDVVVAGDTGLHLMSWTAPGPDGPMTALSVAVLLRQSDGSWKMVIDHPFGDAVMHQE